MMIKPLNVLSLMCGTSFESLKNAFVKTDGVDIYETFGESEMPLPAFLRVKIDLTQDKNPLVPDDKLLIDTVENDMTDLMIRRIDDLIQNTEQKIDLIAIEGPTITHCPEKKYTYQLGKGQQIFEAFGIPTVSHFHNADILNGGEGNPISATYFNALAVKAQKPILFINIGGVTSLIYIGNFGEMISFDCTAGNAMLNDFVKKHGSIAMDYNGKCAALGKPNLRIVETLLRHRFFEKMPPKSLPRNLFNDKTEHFEGLSLEDGAATITEFIAESIVRSVLHMLPSKPNQVIICGGGAKNPTLTRLIRQKLKKNDINAEDHDDITPNDAAAIAFLGARCYYHLPITFPQTTGVSASMTGGKIYQKEQEI